MFSYTLTKKSPKSSHTASGIQPRDISQLVCLSHPLDVMANK